MAEIQIGKSWAAYGNENEKNQNILNITLAISDIKANLKYPNQRYLEHPTSPRILPLSHTELCLDLPFKK